MKKAVLLAAVAAGLAAGAALGVFVPRWLAPGATTTQTVTKPQVAPASPVRVEVAAVQEIPFARGLSAVGSLRSDESVVLRPEVAGRIQTIEFKEGQPVTRGQTLIRAGRLRATRRIGAGPRQPDPGAKPLPPRRGIAGQGLRQPAGPRRIRQHAQGSGSRRGAGAGPAGQDDDLGPFGGIVGLRSVSVGDYVNQGQDLAPLEAIDPLKVDFRVPEMYLSKVGVGQQLTLRLDALPGQERQGLVYAVSPLVDAGGRSILLRATVANKDAVLRPGMFARVQLLFNQDKALVAPEAALSPSGETQYVYRIKDGRAERREVTIGERREGRVEILTGVAAGDKLVVAGMQRVTDGATVDVVGGGS